jgi:hypothetical protein
LDELKNDIPASQYEKIQLYVELVKAALRTIQ